MDHEVEVEVFRAGDYGPRGTYSEEDLESVAADYAPEIHEAPVTVDHKQEGPALGWVRGLRRAGKLLIARLGGLNADFLEKLRSGAFKKRSVEMYRVAEATGRPYLRAVTFLGAGAPVVKGLPDPVFAEKEETVRIAFEETGFSCEEDARRDHAGEPRQEIHPQATLPISEPRRDPDPKTSRTSEPSQTFAEIDPETARFCEEMRRTGRLLPAWEEKGVAAFLSALDDRAALCFSSSSEAAPQTARAWFREFLGSLAEVVPMGEAAPAGEAGNGAQPGNLGPLPHNGRGVRVDEESIALHRRVCRFRQAHPDVCYAEALGAVVRGA
jgi:hypothetical protein